MKKKCRVIMLPTEKEGVIMSDTGAYDTDMVVMSEIPVDLRDHDRPHNHLYFTTYSEGVKEGDWFIYFKQDINDDGDETGLFKAGEVSEGCVCIINSPTYVHDHECQKVIATTDPELIIETAFGDVSDIIDNPETLDTVETLGLPLIPESFIEEYVNNPVDEVMVEYDQYWEKVGGEYPKTPQFKLKLINKQIVAIPITVVSYEEELETEIVRLKKKVAVFDIIRRTTPDYKVLHTDSENSRVHIRRAFADKIEECRLVELQLKVLKEKISNIIDTENSVLSTQQKVDKIKKLIVKQ